MDSRRVIWAYNLAYCALFCYQSNTKFGIFYLLHILFNILNFEITVGQINKIAKNFEYQILILENYLRHLCVFINLIFPRDLLIHILFSFLLNWNLKLGCCLRSKVRTLQYEMHVLSKCRTRSQVSDYVTDIGRQHLT